jgi:hypothetical protein
MASNPPSAPHSETVALLVSTGKQEKLVQVLPFVLKELEYPLMDLSIESLRIH